MSMMEVLEKIVNNAILIGLYDRVLSTLLKSILSVFFNS